MCIYEKERKAAPDRMPQGKLAAAMLADIPNELLHERGQATLALNREAALEIISRIDKKASDLAAGIKVFVENFQMSELRDLLEKASA